MYASILHQQTTIKPPQTVVYY